mmetsp:Transcript_19968/g.64843  ORF Transcript_19968/g.64843 Transcript_19968/m.64843 type:complete len:290 (+) Transcript_19968:782-1651(+)
MPRTRVARLYHRPKTKRLRWRGGRHARAVGDGAQVPGRTARPRAGIHGNHQPERKLVQEAQREVDHLRCHVVSDGGHVGRQQPLGAGACAKRSPAHGAAAGRHGRQPVPASGGNGRRRARWASGERPHRASSGKPEHVPRPRPGRRRRARHGRQAAAQPAGGAQRPRRLGRPPPAAGRRFRRRVPEAASRALGGVHIASVAVGDPGVPRLLREWRGQSRTCRAKPRLPVWRQERKSMPGDVGCACVCLCREGGGYPNFHMPLYTLFFSLHLGSPQRASARCVGCWSWSP